ncbi:MAG: hypothetical protein GY760_21770 [Deltaproteobacteria bacterium]|nr:hypothetical protein [Deltaproteobacteria bacterium]
MSPYHNQNKGYAKQERKDLLKDNPVARDASGGRPWISKHFKSSMSPLREGHEGSPAKDAGHGKKFTDEHFPSGKHRSDIKMDSPNPDMRPKMDHK